MTHKATVPGIEQLFRGLGDRTRLRLLNLMAAREVCVCYFVEILGLPQPTISRHLAYLRRTGLVRARREGKWMHYRIDVPADPFARQLVTDVLRWVRNDPGMQKDRARLNRVCCAPERFVNLQDAPAPIAVGDLAGGQRLK